MLWEKIQIAVYYKSNGILTFWVDTENQNKWYCDLDTNVKGFSRYIFERNSLCMWLPVWLQAWKRGWILCPVESYTVSIGELLKQSTHLACWNDLHTLVICGTQAVWAMKYLGSQMVDWYVLEIRRFWNRRSSNESLMDALCSRMQYVSLCFPYHLPVWCSEIQYK